MVTMLMIRKSKFPLISSAGFHHRYKAVSQSDGMCPCVICRSELSVNTMVHHFDLCCSITHGGYPPANGQTDGPTNLWERDGSRTEEANAISIAHPSVELRRM